MRFIFTIAYIYGIVMVRLGGVWYVVCCCFAASLCRQSGEPMVSGLLAGTLICCWLQMYHKNKSLTIC